MAALPNPVQVVCMLVGDRYPNLYLPRLANMLSRHMHVPYVLTCIVDRPRPLPPGVQSIDASQWSEMHREGMRLTTNKIRLFDPDTIPFQEFVYLDVTLVIQKDMRPLLEYAFGREEDLVIVKDWNYDCYNSCVMRIRTSDAMRRIYTAFVEGKTYPYRNPGDQDFIHACAQDLGLQKHIAFFEPDHVVSFRNIRELHRTDPQAAYEAIRKGTIVKFFGKPKMHQVADPMFNLFKIRLKNLAYGSKDAGFWLKELREHWR